jgi:hypothetical protein
MQFVRAVFCNRIKQRLAGIVMMGFETFHFKCFCTRD